MGAGQTATDLGDEIDCEIRPLVKLLNQMSGIRTVYSCAGHEEGEQAYVTCVAESLADLKHLISCLPTGERSSLVSNRWSGGAVWVDAGLSADGELWHTIRVAGTPLYMRRLLIGEIEQAIRHEIAVTAARSAPAVATVAPKPAEV